MTLERKIAKVFRLTDENWMKHSNPWSVYTRYSVLPLIILAFWSRIWIGWWCLIPGLMSILWMFFNPVFFSKPQSTKNWASKSVLVTYLYSLLNIISSAGMILSIWAMIYYSIWGAILGVALAYLGKSWYLDRMVWLYESMKSENEEYKKWEY